jgi:hypothetical protein
MDPITTAIVTALGVGALSGLTETGKTTLTDAYHTLKDLLTRKFGAKSEVVQAINLLETKPDSADRQKILQEEIAAINTGQDTEVLEAAKRILSLVQAQQAGVGKFIIQNNALVQGQMVGDHNTITQQFGEIPTT